MNQEARRTVRVSDVAVIGCGIIGLAIAQQLQARGRGCVLIDPTGPAGGASSGNAGAVAVGNLFPQVSVSMMFDALLRQHNPLMPFKLDAGALPHNLRWLWRLARSGHRKRIEAGVRALHAINREARRAWLTLADTVDLRAQISERGFLSAYSDDAAFERAAWTRDLLREHGVAHDVLDAAQLRDIEPGLAAGFRHGVLQRDALFVRDSDEFCRRMFNRLCAAGADTLIGDAHAIEREGTGYRVSTSRGAAHVDQVVVAAGMWSTALLADWDVRLPLAAVRGYHATFATPGPIASRPMHWAERDLLASPVPGGLRVAAVKELTAGGRPARPQLLAPFAQQAQRMFPALPERRISEGHGLRPCTPDSLPLLGRVRDERIFVATGHGHLGLTQGPICAEWIASLMLDEKPAADLSPYRLDRFERRDDPITPRPEIPADATPRTP